VVVTGKAAYMSQPANLLTPTSIMGRTGMVARYSDEKLNATFPELPSMATAALARGKWE